jgi:hypothetical protein
MSDTPISKPMLFSSSMILALLDGSKSMTRRMMKPQPDAAFLARGVEGIVPQWPAQNGVRWFMSDGLSELVKCPHPPGSRIWVKETFTIANCEVVYRASVSKDDMDLSESWMEGPWKPSIFMPKWASRITLEVTAVKVERLQDISEEDAKAEGVSPICKCCYGLIPCSTSEPTWLLPFQRLWETIHGPGSWEQNPWLWVYQFKRIKP